MIRGLSRWARVFACGALIALASRAAAADDPRIIPLWPEGVPNAKPDGGVERLEDGRVFNVQVPTMEYFPAPAENANGTAVIVCPGGGYVRLSIFKEGTDYAKMLNRLGVSAFVLKYRLVEYGHPAPLQDVLRAVRVVRSRAKEFNVNPDRVGLMGSSAGGHLTASAATLFDAPEGRTGNATMDGVSGRPSFAILMYPVITMKPPFLHAGSKKSLIGENASSDLVDRLSLELQVTANTPPAFIIHTEEDATVPIENSLAFFQGLRKFKVDSEMHLYEKGPHGFGLRSDLGPTSEWPKRLEEWMRAHGWLAR